MRHKDDYRASRRNSARASGTLTVWYTEANDLHKVRPYKIKPDKIRFVGEQMFVTPRKQPKLYA